MRILNYVIDAAAAASTDNFAEINGILHIGSLLTTRTPVNRFLDIRFPVIKQVTAAEVLQVQDITVVGTTNGVTYSFLVNSYDPLYEVFRPTPYIIQTPTTGTLTATTIAAQLVALITADPNARVTAANVAGVITVTAKTGYSTFQLKPINAGDGTGTLTVTQPPSTLGVIAFGKTPYLDLQRQGLTSSQYTGSTAGYTLYTYVTEQQYAETNDVTTQHPAKVNIWINTDDAQAAALVTAIDVVFNAAAYRQATFDILP